MKDAAPSMVFSGLSGGVYTPEFMTIRLQPQMKKYRCLWCKSTTNHYILYFVHTFVIHFINKGNSLWKARNRLVRRRFRERLCLQTRATSALGLPADPFPKPSPRRARVQGAETVQSSRKRCELWTNRYGLARICNAVYDIVGFVKALFGALGRKKSITKRPFGKAGVKGAYFAFISTLDTGLAKPTLELGSNLRCSF